MLPTRFPELVRLFPPQAIHDDTAYTNTQKMIDRLTSLPKPTPGQAEYLETLTIRFEAYDRDHDEIDAEGLSPVDALRFLLESNDLTASDLGGSSAAANWGPRSSMEPGN